MANRTLQGIETESIYSPTTQVYKATHDGAGNRLPFRYRSYISFSFGDKLIEDFGLIATTEGDRLERNACSNFEDITETFETHDGQIYWGSHLTNNELHLTLASDGITSRQLDEFRQWFAPGKVRELILMEHPNRAIMARVSEVPKISMLPFATSATTKITGYRYNTQITLLKGTISLSFTMSEPFWYAKYNLILPTIKGGGANGLINIHDDPYRIRDMLFNISGKRFYIEYKRKSDNKIISSSFTPYDFFISEEGYWNLTCFFDNGNLEVISYPDDIISLQNSVITLPDDSGRKDIMNEDARDYAKIILEDNIPHLAMIQTPVLLGEDIGAINDAESRVYNNQETIIEGLDPWTGAHVQYFGYVGFDIKTWYQDININRDTPQYLFYSGTAPSKPTLKFTLTPTFNNLGYVNSPRNSYTHDLAAENYNYIALDDTFFYFTTPSLISGYNQAIKIVRDYKNGKPFIDLITYLKENVNEYYSRAWAIFCAKTLEENTTYVDNSGNIIKDTFVDAFIPRMKYLICGDEEGSVPGSFSCEFNSKTGQSKISYSVVREANVNPTFDINFSNIPIKKDLEQNAGDMVKSDYLIIEGRNYPSFEGYITQKECHVITTDFDAEHSLTNVTLTFQNMYY